MTTLYAILHGNFQWQKSRYCAQLKYFAKILSRAKVQNVLTSS